jgi:hypothetical protein
MDNEKWQVEGLLKRAFNRTKERFLSYFLTWVASFGMGIGVLVLILLAAGLIAILYGVTKSVLVVGVLGLAIGIGSYVALIYVSSWIALATISVMTSEEKLGVGATFSKVKPLIWGYFWMSFLSGLFMLGLMPWGVLSLGVVFVLWALWSSFMSFVYLKFQKKGLQNLWISRQMFRQNPWGIFGRSALLMVAIWAISIAINLVFGSMGKNGSMASSGISMIFSILYAPFAMSFSYEMFLNLEEPKEEVKTPSVWVMFSVLGWVLSILAFVGTIGLLVSQAPVLMQKANEMKNLKNVNQLQMDEQFKNLKPEEQEFLNKMKEIAPTVRYALPTSVPTVGSSSGTMGY